MGKVTHVKNQPPPPSPTPPKGSEWWPRRSADDEGTGMFRISTLGDMSRIKHREEGGKEVGLLRKTRQSRNLMHSGY